MPELQRVPTDQLQEERIEIEGSGKNMSPRCFQLRPVQLCSFFGGEGVLGVWWLGSS